MLAVVGFAATDLGFRIYPDPTGMHQVSSVAAHNAAVQWGGMQQILIWLGLIEVVSAVAIKHMINEKSGRIPGDFNLDPLNFCKDAKSTADLKLKETVHCRLAMFAIGGMATQAVLTGGSFPYV